MPKSEKVPDEPEATMSGAIETPKPVKPREIVPGTEPPPVTDAVRP